jgi:hypothetical protein
MARKSPLTDKQWSDIERRLLNGESANSLAKEFGISEGAIRKRFGAKVRTIKEVGKQLVDAELALENLDIGTKVRTRKYADELKAMLGSLTTAGALSAKTSSKLALIAHAQAELIDPRKTIEENKEAIRSVMAFQAGANNAAQIGLGLMKTNQDFMDAEIGKEAAEATEVAQLGKDPIEAAATYQRMIAGR